MARVAAAFIVGALLGFGVGWLQRDTTEHAKTITVHTRSSGGSVFGRSGAFGG